MFQKFRILAQIYYDQKDDCSRVLRRLHPGVVNIFSAHDCFGLWHVASLQNSKALVALGRRDLAQAIAAMHK